MAEFVHLVELRELPSGNTPNGRRTPSPGRSRRRAVEDVLGGSIGERPDHGANIVVQPLTATLLSTVGTKVVLILHGTDSTAGEVAPKPGSRVGPDAPDRQCWFFNISGLQSPPTKVRGNQPGPRFVLRYPGWADSLGSGAAASAGSRRGSLKLKHIVLSLLLAAVAAGGFAQDGDGQDAGSTNARHHIVIFGATASAPPPTANARVHIVVFGRESDDDNEDSGTAGRETRTRAPRDRAVVRQLVQMVAPRISPRVMRAALAAGLRMTF